MFPQSSRQLDPELSAAMLQLRERGLTARPPHVAPLTEARRSYQAVGFHLSALSPALAHEQTIAAPGPAGEIQCKLVRPDQAPAAAPTVVYFHGGGFAMGRADEWVGFAREFARKSGAAVLLVDYRLAPEHPFPAALDDALAVARFIGRDGAAHGIDARRIVLGGDSAGANLALLAAQALSKSQELTPALLVLFYGVYSMDWTGPEWAELAAFGLPPEMMDWIWRTYLPSGPDPARPAAPLDADVSGLPFVFQMVGDLDPLQRDAVRLRAALDAAGVPNELLISPGLNHGCVRFSRLAASVDAVLDKAADAVRARVVVRHGEYQA